MIQVDGILKHVYVNASDDIAAYDADQCDRQAVTAQFAFNNLVDAPIWVYRAGLAEEGMDPWLLVTGMDMFIRDVDDYKAGTIILEYGNAGDMKVGPPFRVFARKKDVEKAAVMLASLGQNLREPAQPLVKSESSDAASYKVILEEKQVKTVVEVKGWGQPLTVVTPNGSDSEIQEAVNNQIKLLRGYDSYRLGRKP